MGDRKGIPLVKTCPVPKIEEKPRGTG